MTTYDLQAVTTAANTAADRVLEAMTDVGPIDDASIDLANLLVNATLGALTNPDRGLALDVLASYGTGSDDQQEVAEMATEDQASLALDRVIGWCRGEG